MIYKQLFSTFVIILFITSFSSNADQVTSTFSTGDTLTEAKLNDLKNNINDNDTRISINTSDIATTSSDIATNTSNISINDGRITNITTQTQNLASGCTTGSSISSVNQDGSITCEADDNSGLSGINFSSSIATTTAPTTAANVDSVTLTVPAGNILVSFSANVSINHTYSATTTTETLRFVITDDNTLNDFNNVPSMRILNVAPEAVSGIYQLSTSTQRVFNVSAGTYTFYVRTVANTSSMTKYSYHNLQALFIPNTY